MPEVVSSGPAHRPSEAARDAIAGVAKEFLVEDCQDTLSSVPLKDSASCSAGMPVKVTRK